MFYDTKFHSVSITLIVTFQSSSVADTAYIIFYLSLSLALLQLVFQSSPSSSQLMDSHRLLSCTPVSLDLFGLENQLLKKPRWTQTNVI